MIAFLIVFEIILLSALIAHTKRISNDEDEIDCDGFESQQCLDLAYEYYGLTPTELSEYGYMQQAILADSIECHYIYDVCPFYIPPVIGKRKDCIENSVAFIDDEDTGNINYYECDNVHLSAFVPIEWLGSNANASGADVWGYQTLDEHGKVNKHYALTSQADGSTIVDITEPLYPNVLAFVVSNVDGALRNVLWRDVKVYKHWAIVSADTGGINDHGIQIFDLDKIIADARTFQANNNGTNVIYDVPKEDVIIYDQVGRCHNVYVDDLIGHLYLFGSEGKNGNDCSTGIHIVDIKDPSRPSFMGCYDGDGYVHDAQCVLYDGPDEEYKNHEICFMFTPEVGNLTIFDVTDPVNIVRISTTTYFTSSYNHQGWITGNHEYLLLDDETDEGPLPDRFPKTQNVTTTYIFDIRDLDNVDYRRAHFSEIVAVDHNQYIVDNGHYYSSNDDAFRGYTFQANYEGGLRILSIDKIANENGNELEEIAYFDMYPWKVDANGTSVYEEIKFFGAWSVYPYFNQIGSAPEEYRYSNKLIVQSTTTGLYVLEFNGNMDFSVDDDDTRKNEENGFSWDAWYGYAIIVILGMVGFFVVFSMYRACIRQSNKKKKVGVYESMVGMEENTKYGSSEPMEM